MKEMLAYARSQAKEMPYVSSGTGTVGHIVFEYVVVKEKLNAVHIPYRAGSAAVIDLLAGRVTVGALNWATARQHVQAGTLIALGVSSAKRLPQLPDLPTLSELGYPDIVDHDLDHDQRRRRACRRTSSMRSTARCVRSR